MDKNQLRDLITRVLKEADLFSDSAVELLMMTAATESKLGYYIRQLGGGPALGIFQMEPATEVDIWGHFIWYKQEYLEIVERISGVVSLPEISLALEADLTYQILMARIHYLRDPYPLPEVDDIDGLAEYYKRVWNTWKGKATIEGAVEAYYKYCK